MTGTPKVGYMAEESGPFRCDHCVHFRVPRHCNNAEVIADPKMRLEMVKGKELAIVAPGGCCCEFKPIIRIDQVKFEDAGL